MTLYPSSASSPVNSRLTPPSREPHSVWMRMHAVSSLMIVPKFRVFRPLADVRVLDRTVVSVDVRDVRVKMQHVLPVHGVRNPDDRVPGLLYCLDMPRKVVLHLEVVSISDSRGLDSEMPYLPCAITRDQRHLSVLAVWVDDWGIDVSNSRRSSIRCYSLSSSLTSSSAFMDGPTFTPMEFRIPRKYSTCAPLSCLVRSPIHRKCADVL